MIKSVKHIKTGSEICFIVKTSLGKYSGVKVADADDLSGVLAIGRSYVVDGDGNYVWKIKLALPEESTRYAFDIMTGENRFTGNYFYYLVEVDSVVKSTVYEIDEGKIHFTVTTSPGDYDRLKVSLSTDPSGTLAYSGPPEENAEGNFVWHINAREPNESTRYAFDLRMKGGTYRKRYSYCKVRIEPLIKSVSYRIHEGEIDFTVVSAPGDYDRMKVAFKDDLAGRLSYTKDCGRNAKGDFIWKLSAPAPAESTSYAFDLRSSLNGNYIKKYYYCHVPVVQMDENGEYVLTIRMTKPQDGGSFRFELRDGDGESRLKGNYSYDS